MSRLNKPAIFGTAISLVYLGILCFLTWLDSEDFRALKPNEWGDYISGGLGPLATFWLVLGFFQQGKEMQQSAKALRMQAEELRHSVDQQKELVVVTRELLDHERATATQRELSRLQPIKPTILCRFGAEMAEPDGRFKYALRIVNAGQAASKLVIQLKHLETTICHKSYPAVPLGWESGLIPIDGAEIAARIQQDLRLEISYFDDDGYLHEIVSELHEPPAQNGFGEFKAIERSRKSTNAT